MTRYVLALLMFTGVATHAEDACRGKCLLVDSGPGSLDTLSRWPRPDLKMLLIADFGTVEGTTVAELNAACAERARPKTNETSKPQVVAFATYYTFGGQSAVIDLVPLKSCDSQF